MGIEYVEVENGYLLKGEALRDVKHREVLYTGGFYEKQLEDTKLGVYAEMFEGDLSLTNYRDKVHSKEKGSKNDLVGLISSFMTVVYLVKRGVLYEPFRSPKNFVHSDTSLRLQVMGRKGTELSVVDDDFLEWVIKMIAFIISEEPVETFEELEVIDYARGLDKDKGKMLSGYLGNKDLDSLFEYTIEESLRDVLDDYVTIGRVPKDDRPSIDELMVRIGIEERERVEREAVENKKREVLRRKQELAVKAEKEGTIKSKLKGIFGKKEKVKVNRVKEDYTVEQKVLRKDDLDGYRKEMGVREEKKHKNYAARIVIMETLSDLLSVGFLAGAVYVAYMFYLWLVG